MTLTFAVTLFAIWVVVSIPVSLMIVSLMRVDPDTADGDRAIGVDSVLRESA
jgi:hypothetical protein